jgi:hypothetical protein
MTKIQLKPITVTYTRTVTFTPTEEMFDDWDILPSQEGFESYVLNELFFDAIGDDMRGNGDPMPYTNIQQLETVEIDWEDEE